MKPRESDFDLSHGLSVASRVSGLDAKLVAVLHDALEDEACTEDELDAAELPPNVVEAIKLLTRAGDLTYKQYIEKLATSGSELAIYVKRADIETNLDRMDDAHASNTDKYRAALATLTFARR